MAPHHQLICEALERVERGECKRLMIFTPPRHGKSELVSRKWPARYIGKFPDAQFISASYGDDLATDFGRDVRNLISSQEYQRLYPGTKLAHDSAAKGKWHTTSGGIYISTSVGKGITGRGCNVLSIDDPVKDRIEAESETVRKNVWDWYASTAYTRLMTGGAIVVTMTRWHEEDLAGRLLEAAKSGGEQWDVITLPGLADSSDDPLGRQIGAPLWPERFSAERLTEIRGVIGEREFGALYQQNPTPLSGGLFNADMIGTIDAIDAKNNTVRAWDFAATEQVGGRNPDWTVGLKLHRTPEGKFVVLDVKRIQGRPEEVLALLQRTAEEDGRGVTIGIPQDPGQAGKWQVQDFTRRLAGWTVKSSPETGDKATRAAPVAAQCNVGNLSMVRGDWNRAFREELRGFPGATKDDQVDALSRAFGMLVAPATANQVKIRGF